MTSQLNVDTIVDKAGSGGTNVKIGNTSTYVSDGGAVAQNAVQGIAKVWFDIDGTGTVTVDNSFNAGSVTDQSTGQYFIAITNNMNNTNYAITFGGAGTGDQCQSPSSRFTSSLGDATNPLLNFNTSGGDYVDIDPFVGVVHGDLA